MEKVVLLEKDRSETFMPTPRNKAVQKYKQKDQVVASYIEL